MGRPGTRPVPRPSPPEAAAQSHRGLRPAPRPGPVAAVLPRNGRGRRGAATGVHRLARPRPSKWNLTRPARHPRIAWTEAAQMAFGPLRPVLPLARPSAFHPLQLHLQQPRSPSDAAESDWVGACGQPLQECPAVPWLWPGWSRAPSRAHPWTDHLVLVHLAQLRVVYGKLELDLPLRARKVQLESVMAPARPLRTYQLSATLRSQGSMQRRPCRLHRSGRC
mmetsp:Transcript_131360/g.366234  ORF Transcript_131360/g.366234 Transcript_131360/m.366234 type:complete len:222 (+) Transcript_131360:488-1153(+)